MESKMKPQQQQKKTDPQPLTNTTTKESIEPQDTIIKSLPNTESEIEHANESSITQMPAESSTNVTNETITTERVSEELTTTENNIDNVPQAECDLTSCKAPAGHESCQPLPVEEGKSCPSQYECNLSTNTNGQPTTIVASLDDDSKSENITQQISTEPTTEENSEMESITESSAFSTVPDPHAPEITTKSSSAKTAANIPEKNGSADNRINCNTTTPAKTTAHAETPAAW